MIKENIHMGSIDKLNPDKKNSLCRGYLVQLNEQNIKYFGFGSTATATLNKIPVKLV